MDDATRVCCSRLLTAPDGSPLAPRSAQAIKNVLDAAREQFMQQEYEVKAVVITRVRAADKAAAMQELCDRLAPGVPDGYQVAAVDAAEVDSAAP